MGLRVRFGLGLRVWFTVGGGVASIHVEEDHQSIEVIQDVGLGAGVGVGLLKDKNRRAGVGLEVGVGLGVGLLKGRYVIFEREIQKSSRSISD